MIGVGSLTGKREGTTHQLEKLLNLEKGNVLFFESGQFGVPLGNNRADLPWTLYVVLVVVGEMGCYRSRAFR